MAGPDIGDPNGHPVPLQAAGTGWQAGGWRAGSRRAHGRQGLSPADGATAARPHRQPRLRIGWFEDDGRTPVEPAIRDAVRRAAEALSRAGFEVVPFRPRGSRRGARAVVGDLRRAPRACCSSRWSRAARRRCIPNLPQFLDWTRRMPRLTAERLLEVEIAARPAAHAVSAADGGRPGAALPRQRRHRVPSRRAHAGTSTGRDVHYLDAWSYAAWFNLLQNPAVSVPAGLTPEGLPVGVQVVARHWEELTALAVARVIERALAGTCASGRRTGRLSAGSEPEARSSDTSAAMTSESKDRAAVVTRPRGSSWGRWSPSA